MNIQAHLLKVVLSVASFSSVFGRTSRIKPLQEGAKAEASVSN